MEVDHVTEGLLVHVSTSRSPPPSLTPSHRASYTLDFKLRVVDWIEKSGTSYRAASRTFGINRKMIRNWVDQKSTLSSALVSLGPHRRKIHSGRPPTSEELERRVFEFLVAERKKGKVVSNRDLQRRGVEVARELGLVDFKGTCSWLGRWKHRHSVAFVSGTNEVVQEREEEEGEGEGEGRRKVEELCGSALLSHVSQCDIVGLSRQSKIDNEEEEEEDGQGEGDGPVFLDYSTPEHNYCHPSDSAMADPPPSLSTSHSPFLHDHPLLSYKVHPEEEEEEEEEGEGDSLTGVSVAEVSGLELPLGHEEVVGGIDYPSAAHQHSSLTRRVPKMVSKAKEKGRRRREKPKQCSPTSIVMFPGLDDLYPGGLLASRLSQPIFPTSPEIVYINMPNN